MTGKQNAPEIRFEGFTDPWEQRKLGELARRVTRKNAEHESDLPLTISAQYGLVDQRTFFNSQVASKDMSGYYLLRKGEFAYNKSTSTDSPWGAIKQLVKYDKGCVSTLYICFELLGADPDYLVAYYETNRWHKAVQLVAAEGARNHGLLNISPDDFFETQLTLPVDKAEQECIGKYFSSLDNLITLHQRKCQYRGLYGYLSWEQRKLGELGFAQSGIGFPDAEQGGTEGTPFFKVSDMNTPGNEYELVASNNYVTAEQIARMGWCPINQVPAIFFAKVGAAVMLNRKRLVNEPFLLDNNTMAFSMDSSLLDTQFGRSLFEHLDLTSLIQVGALPSFNSSDVESISVSLPSTMNEQRQIGQYLSDLNTLITLHQRMCSIFCFCAHGSRINFASILQGQLRILRYLRPMPKMRASPSALASGTTDIAVALSFSVLSPLARRPARQEELHH